MSDNHANSEADRSGRAAAPSLRDRIADVIAGVDDWRGVTDPAILAEAVIVELGLLGLDQTFELHEKGCVCDDCWPDDIG